MEAAEVYEHPRRIAVIGTSGSGKTTLARKVAQHLGIAHVELDALHWGPNWNPVSREVFRERVSRALAGDAWTTDGNYGVVRDIVWTRADTVVWLDYPLPVIMGRVTRRTIRRFVTREELWNGNRERFWEAFFSRDSIIWWALRTYRRRKREYPISFSQPEFSHLRIVHLSLPRTTFEWLEGLPAAHDEGQMTNDEAQDPCCPRTG